MFNLTIFWKVILFILFIPLIIKQIQLGKKTEIIILTIGFIIYTIQAISMMFFPIFFDSPKSNYRIFESINIIPFKPVIKFIQANASKKIIFKLTLGNVALLFPLGFLLPIISKKSDNFFFILKLGFFIIILIGIFKLSINNITRTNNYMCNIDSLILNPIGLVLGYFLQECLKKFLLINFKYKFN